MRALICLVTCLLITSTKKIKIARPRYEIELLVSTPWRR